MTRLEKMWERDRKRFERLSKAHKPRSLELMKLQETTTRLLRRDVKRRKAA